VNKKLPVIAAIPAFNSERTLGPLLEQVLEQEYDEVIVVDDASTDNTLELIHSFRNDVTAIAGKENLGPGGNRNRIMPELGYSAIVHFIDSDVRLNSHASPEIARELGAAAKLGYVGGLVRNPDGRQNPYNYGPRPSLWKDGSAVAQYALWGISRFNEAAAKALRAPLAIYLRDWPNFLREPAPKDEVFWASEANMVIPAGVFVNTGGYDPRYRFSEVFDYSIRLSKLGLKRSFDPSLDVSHLTPDTASDKQAGRTQTAKQLRAQYGNAQYYFGEGVASTFSGRG